MKKKDEGIIDQALGILLTMIFVVILVLGCMYYSNWITTKNNNDATCRKYMLKMESDGYLDNKNKSELIRDLNNLGVTNIDLSGTTQTETTYGSQVILRVKGTINLEGIRLGAGSTIKHTVSFPLDIRKESISKN